MSHVVVTANRLRDGVPVWRDRHGAWADSFDRAEPFETAAAEAALAAATGDVARQLVVGVYKASVSLRDGRPVPDNVREAIRSDGPSVRLDLGIQAPQPETPA